MNIAGFEGPEKIIELIFTSDDNRSTFLSVEREKWDVILDSAICKILDKASNEYIFY